MSRRIKKHKTTIDLKKIINESILEVFDSKIQTSFKEVNYGDISHMNLKPVVEHRMI